MNNFLANFAQQKVILYFCSMKYAYTLTLLTFFVTCLFTDNPLFSQVSTDSTNFGSPLDISLIVAGNFGEVRSNHFHTGIDFKTQGVEGKKIYSIDDGYVSRIGYSHYGYGKVLYITHPNGYTSVYAHLSKFNSSISDFVRTHQYSIQQETFTVYLDSNQLKVKKGEIIGLSGNSGGSYAPHLHFEIRETESEHPMNPLLFGYQISDTKKPMLNNLKIYPLNDSSLVNGKSKPVIIPVNKTKNGTYYLNQKPTAFGHIGCALHSTDRMNARNICGLYSLELSVNGDSLFKHTMDELNFSTSRYVNHHVDYPRHKQYNNSFHKSFLTGNNKLDIYSHKNQGITKIQNDSIYRFNYQAQDFAGNTSKLAFTIQGDSSGISKTKTKSSSCKNYFKYNKLNVMNKKGFTALLTPNTLYEDLCVSYQATKTSKYLSDIHSFGTRLAGIHKTYKVIITPNKLIDSSYHDKLLIISINDKGRVTDRGGNFQEGTVTTRVREFGKFAVAMDTTKPYVRLEDKQNVNALKSNATITFKISDDLSGIESYSATLDGEWILTEYDRKRGKWNISLSEKENLNKGTHKLVLEVIDEKENNNKSEILIYIL